MRIRSTKPASTNKCYIHTTDGGYNKCIRIAKKGEPLTALPNCVGYAYGRFMEHAGLTKCTLPVSNANTWYDKTKYKKGKTPKIGAVMCWDDGEFGHVAIVEQIIDENTIITSDSVYCGESFRIKRRTKAGNWGMPAKYKLQGFIYNPGIKQHTVETVLDLIINKKVDSSIDFNADRKVDYKDVLTILKSIY